MSPLLVLPDLPFSARTVPSRLSALAGPVLGLLWCVGSAPAQCTNPWQPMAAGLASEGVALARMANGDVVAARTFAAFGDTREVVERWDGTAWSPLGAYFRGGAGGVVSAISDLLALPNGDLVAGGWFTRVNGGGTVAENVAYWNGATWQPLGNTFGFLQGLDYWVHALAFHNGQVVAAGEFGSPAPFLAKLSGSTWVAFAPGDFNDVVQALAVMPNGDLVAAGPFTSHSLAGPRAHIARWSGSSWQAMGSGMNSDVAKLWVLPDGDLVASGAFTTAGGNPAPGVARWNGSAWSAIASPSQLSALASLPNGDTLLGGYLPTSYLSRWNGLAASPIAGTTNGGVADLLALPDGTVVATGAFTTIGGTTAARVARWTTTCPAIQLPLANGCPSSGGSNTLTTTSPWAGSALSSTGTGLPAFAFVAAVTGFAPTSLPLAAVFPTGQPGCFLRANPDLVDLLISNAGTAQYQLALPNSMAVAGIVLHHQMIPMEVDLALNFVAITATNSVQLTVGYF